MRISQWKSKLCLTAGYLLAVAVFYCLRIGCVFQRFFGIPCPGCGMTRALLAVLRLDLKAAFFYHPMFWSIPILYLYFLSDNGIFKRKFWNRAVLWGICAGFLINWLLKLL